MYLQVCQYCHSYGKDNWKITVNKSRKNIDPGERKGDRRRGSGKEKRGRE